MLLSLRNTFRRRGRLVLTLLTLTLAGAMVIGVLSVRVSLLRTLDDFFLTYNYDVMLFTERPYRRAAMEHTVRAVPGVTAVESWIKSSGRVLNDGTKTDTIAITAPPANTTLFKPQLIEGRWLLPDDQNALVIAADLRKTEPDLKLGDTVVLDINGREMEWKIVGVAQVLFVNRQAYASYDYLSRLTNNVDQSSYLAVVTAQHDLELQEQVAKQIREDLKAQGIDVSGTNAIGSIRAQNASNFNIIVVMLMVMAILLAVVGGLGLMGTMSINVLERTREIGVMRAIGASNGAILGIVIVEGIIIGLVSWLIGALIAIPFSALLSQAVGLAFLQSPLNYIFSVTGAALWLALVILLAAVASFLPAWNASRVTVRDVLAYE